MMGDAVMPSRKTITQLYAEFEEALAAAKALEPFIEKSKAKEKEYGDVIAVIGKLCRRIVEAPANPTNLIPEMLHKIDAAGWGVDAWSGGSLANWTLEQADDDQAIAASCLVSIREDLRAMQTARKKA
jgi:hypothetical protein